MPDLRALFLVGAGGFLGANARYLVGALAALLWGTRFPLGTLLINISGSFLLAAFLAWATLRLAPGTPPSSLHLLFATGFCGAYTTFSTFAADSVRLIQTGDWGAGLANIALTNVLCLAASALGFWVGTR